MTSFPWLAAFYPSGPGKEGGRGKGVLSCAVAIVFSPDTTRRLHGSVKRFAAEHLDDEMGGLKDALVLDFVLKEIGPTSKRSR